MDEFLGRRSLPEMPFKVVGPFDFVLRGLKIASIGCSAMHTTFALPSWPLPLARHPSVR